MPRWLFAVIVVSGVWIGLTPWLAAVWVLVIGIAIAAARLDLDRPSSLPARPPWLLALFASLPTFIYLATTWYQEFPYTGDQVHHNGYAIETFAFWWPWRWLVAVAAGVAVHSLGTPRVPICAPALPPPPPPP